MFKVSEPPQVEPVLPQLGHAVNSSAFELFGAGFDPAAFGLEGWGDFPLRGGNFA
jgi:hypothetical protein